MQWCGKDPVSVFLSVWLECEAWKRGGAAGRSLGRRQGKTPLSHAELGAVVVKRRYWKVLRPQLAPNGY